MINGNTNLGVDVNIENSTQKTAKEKYNVKRENVDQFTKHVLDQQGIVQVACSADIILPLAINAFERKENILFIVKSITALKATKKELETHKIPVSCVESIQKICLKLREKVIEIKTRRFLPYSKLECDGCDCIIECPHRIAVDENHLVNIITYSRLATLVMDARTNYKTSDDAEKLLDKYKKIKKIVIVDLSQNITNQPKFEYEEGKLREVMKSLDIGNTSKCQYKNACNENKAVNELVLKFAEYLEKESLKIKVSDKDKNPVRIIDNPYANEVTKLSESGINVYEVAKRLPELHPKNLAIKTLSGLLTVIQSSRIALSKREDIKKSKNKEKEKPVSVTKIVVSALKPNSNSEKSLSTMENFASFLMNYTYSLEKMLDYAMKVKGIKVAEDKTSKVRFLEDKTIIFTDRRHPEFNILEAIGLGFISNPITRVTIDSQIHRYLYCDSRHLNSYDLNTKKEKQRIIDIINQYEIDNTEIVTLNKKAFRILKYWVRAELIKQFHISYYRSNDIEQAKNLILIGYPSMGKKAYWCEIYDAKKSCSELNEDSLTTEELRFAYRIKLWNEYSAIAQTISAVYPEFIIAIGVTELDINPINLETGMHESVILNCEVTGFPEKNASAKMFEWVKKLHYNSKIIKKTSIPTISMYLTKLADEIKDEIDLLELHRRANEQDQKDVLMQKGIFEENGINVQRNRKGNIKFKKSPMKSVTL